MPPCPPSRPRPCTAGTATPTPPRPATPSPRTPLTPPDRRPHDRHPRPHEKPRLELLIVLTQALAAIWFYRLFRTADPLAASGIAAFGLVNAVTVLVSAALLATAVEIALNPIGDAATTVQLLYLVSGNLWGVGALFFGLWLIPMGSCVLRSGWMPRPLGWVLVSGGIGYVLSAFIRYLAPEAQVVADALAYPATVGEFWIIIYLLAIGVRRRALDEAPRDAGTAAPAST